MRGVRTGQSPNAKGNDQRVPNNLRLLQTQLENRGSYKLNRETETGDVWIDGRPIFRTVLELGTLPNATVKDVSHNVPFRELLRIYGYASDGMSTLPLPHSDGGASVVAVFAISGANGSIRISTGLDRTAYTTAYVVLEYTK